MRIGFGLPQFGALAERPEEVARFARQAEAAGADSLWVAERLLAPVNPSIGYGGTSTFPPHFRRSLDPFAVLTTAAAVTGRVQVGTSVIIAPWYPAPLLARSLTAIDVLSGGRLIPGFGTGWSPEEYQAVGVAMTQRGERLDEFLDVLEALWTTSPAEHHGKHWTIAASHADLKPRQRPRPPIYLAGFTPAALRRVARRADGWLPVARASANFDPTAIALPFARIRQAAERQGRDPSQIGAILRVNSSATATPADIADTILRAGQEAGIGHAFADLTSVAASADQALDICGQVIDRVGPR